MTISAHPNGDVFVNGKLICGSNYKVIVEIEKAVESITHKVLEKSNTKSWLDSVRARRNMSRSTN